MKKIVLLVPILLLSSCGGFERHFSEIEVTFEDGFKILQITDTHWGVGTQFDLEEQYMTRLIEQADDPDLIAITGDAFMHANRQIVNRYFAFFDSFDIPFAYNYGNHDFQGQYDVSYIESVLAKCENSLFNSDHVFQLFDDLAPSDYIVNLKRGEEVIWQLYFLNSNSYAYGSYDIFHPNQIEWYENAVEYSTETFSDGINPIPSLSFFHIPFQEYATAYRMWQDGTIPLSDGDGENRERVAPQYSEDLMFEKMVELGSTKGCFVGHDHINYSWVKYQGITLSYGLKTGQNIYHDKDLMGAQMIIIEDETNFRIERIFQTYEELSHA